MKQRIKVTPDVYSAIKGKLVFFTDHEFGEIVDCTEDHVLVRVVPTSSKNADGTQFIADGDWIASHPYNPAVDHTKKYAVHDYDISSCDIPESMPYWIKLIDTKSTETKECAVCLDHRRSVALNPCGHYCLCETCVCQLRACPICRKPIESSIKVYEV